MRNLDVTTLRSFVAVAEHGGVTRAAAMLNLTQSAVSMQIKRLEEALDIALLDRAHRRVSLTTSGEQLLGYARRMVALNDEAVSRLTHQMFEGEVTLGVPHDIVYPLIPQVLKEFSARYPRMKVHLLSSFSEVLKDQMSRGECDLALTTEPGVDRGGETLISKPLKWVGAADGMAWKRRPLPLAFNRACAFRPIVIAALEEAGIGWEMAVETDSDRSIEATVSADIAVHAMIDGTEPAHLAHVAHGGALPDLPGQMINLYGAGTALDETTKTLTELVRQAYGNW